MPASPALSVQPVRPVRARLDRAASVPRGLVGVVGLLVLLAPALSGCGGDDGPGAAATSSTPAPTDDASHPVSPPDLPSAPSVQDPAGAAADIAWDECPTDAGHQTVHGTVTNPTKRQLSYVVQISWTNDSADVLGRGFAVVRDLAPGATEDWTLDAQVVGGARQCVPYVLRGDAVAD